MHKKIIVILPILIVVVLLSYGVYVKNNTSLLTIKPNVEQIKNNNQNLTPKENAQNYTQLVTSTLEVSEKYKKGVFASPKELNLPNGFKISVFAAGLVKPRAITFDENGTIYITDTNFNVSKSNGGEVFAIIDTNADGVADEINTVDSNLIHPHGIDLYNGDLYVGEEHQIIVYRNIKPNGEFDEKETLIPNLPNGVSFTTGSGHVTRTVKVNNDKIYVSVGSSCNVCEEKDPKRAAILKYSINGEFEEYLGTGLRNSVDFIFVNTSEFTQEIWAVNNGRDRIGDDIPPEELNVIRLDGNQTTNHYGWPYCYGQGISNPEFSNKTAFCQNETHYPLYEMQAHSAPLGLSFHAYRKYGDSAKTFPDEIISDLFIAYHGSWNRTVPTGYKIVRLDTSEYFKNPEYHKQNSDITKTTLSTQPVNFITGWLQEDGNAWGRPVDIDFDSKGIMYITDDKAGAIYRVEYATE
ncbi:MAG: PQQ-dependent sugar dehydrogenase [Patescibacteria group bacterium]